MLCQLCGNNEANFHYTTNMNGTVKALHLCGECAKKPEYSDSFKQNSGFNPFLLNILNAASKLPDMDEKQCGSCGITMRRLRKTGKAGCADCYEVFSDMLIPYIRRIHGSAIHKGKVPKSAGPEYARKRELEDLKREIVTAVNIQDYERAAVLRDRIKELEKGAG